MNNIIRMTALAIYLSIVSLLIVQSSVDIKAVSILQLF